MAMDFTELFQSMTGHGAPFPWQAALAARGDCGDRLIRVETGMGKTQGVLGAWLYHRVVLGDARWPRRLVWCLPMRTLVEQVRDELAACLTRAGFPIEVHVVMGGEDAGDWHLYPERDAVLVGTSDMLLSRALNRGYASARARWPMEFGQLHSDCLWVLDEVQIMDAGLSTTAQLQAFREQDRDRTPRPTWSWWMSATLRADWLRSVDTQEMIDAIGARTVSVGAEDRKGDLWTTVSKPLELVPAMEDKELAAFVFERQAKDGTTLVIVNTVKRAVAVYETLRKRKELAVDLRLVHSRFRPHERRAWREEFLHRGADSANGRIIVSTQVVEAGVDLSADCLITELAPWPSLVQRFGRAARYGGTARVFVVDIAEEKKAPPYEFAELEAARRALEGMSDVALPALALRQESLTPAELAELFPYSPEFLLLRRELEDLFDTTPDLTGADLDISRFIRAGEERDCQLFWRELERGGRPADSLRPARDELCAAPVGDVRKWFEGAPRDQGILFWRWDYLDGTWVPVKKGDVAPGQVFLCAARAGGYSEKTGFSPKSKPAPVVPALLIAETGTDADAREDDEALARVDEWRTIAEHGADVAGVLDGVLGAVFGAEPGAMATPVGARNVLELAARWHDLGKAHPAFASLLVPGASPLEGPVAKAPEAAWKSGPARYEINQDGVIDARPGFRHELASVLALFDALRQADPLHEGLLGPWRSWFGSEDLAPGDAAPEMDGNAVQKALLELSSAELDLLLYLIASHHGKVRMGFCATPADQRHPVSREGDKMPIRGVLDGDRLPEVELTVAGGSVGTLPATALSLEPAALGLSPVTGASWAQRCVGLLATHGPFALAWMEALLRAADIRASRRSS